MYISAVIQRHMLRRRFRRQINSDKEHQIARELKFSLIFNYIYFMKDICAGICTESSLDKRILNQKGIPSRRNLTFAKQIIMKITIFKSDFNTPHILICTITRTPCILFKYNKSDFGRIFYRGDRSSLLNPASFIPHSLLGLCH